VLNVSLAAFSGPLGAALRCDALRAASAYLSAGALSSVSVGMLNPPWTQAALSDSILGNDVRACDGVCEGVRVYRASNSSTTGSFATINGTACTSPLGCCPSASQFSGPFDGQCLAVNRTTCADGNPVLNDASCALSNGTAAECHALSDRRCALINSSTVAYGMCAKPSPAPFVVAPPLNIVAVALDFSVLINATVPNATYAASLIQSALNTAFAQGAAGVPAFTAALAANCRQLVIGGCAALPASPADPASVPAVASASSYSPATPPAAPPGSAPTGSSNVGLAVGLTVFVLFLIAAVYGGKRYADYRRAKRHEEKPRRESVIDYEHLHRGEFVKQSVISRPVSAAYDGGSNTQVVLVRANSTRGTSIEIGAGASLVVENPSYRLSAEPIRSSGV
jgi:hypothetical protein